MPNRLHQMGFAQSDAAVDEKRVVLALGGRICHRPRRRVRDVVASADDEVIEGVFFVERRGKIFEILERFGALLALGRAARRTLRFRFDNWKRRGFWRRHNFDFPRLSLLAVRLLSFGHDLKAQNHRTPQKLFEGFLNAARETAHQPVFDKIGGRRKREFVSREAKRAHVAQIILVSRAGKFGLQRPHDFLPGRVHDFDGLVDADALQRGRLGFERRRRRVKIGLGFTFQRRIETEFERGLALGCGVGHRRLRGSLGAARPVYPPESGLQGHFSPGLSIGEDKSSENATPLRGGDDARG